MNIHSFNKLSKETINLKCLNYRCYSKNGQLTFEKRISTNGKFKGDIKVKYSK